MISHEKAKQIAFECLKKIENVKVLSTEEGHELFPKAKVEIWEVKSEILLSNNILEQIIFNILFLPDFPLSFPKVFLSKNDYEKTKFIPHVEVSRLVCTFQNQAQPNPDKPSEVVQETLRKAKRIVEDGLNGVNTSDFTDEFIPYWESEYSSKDSVSSNILLIANLPLETNVRLLKILKPFNKISFIIHQDEDIAVRFKSFLEDNNRTFTETQGLFLGNWESKLDPPYDLTNKKVIELVKSEFPSKFKEYCNYLDSEKNIPKLILFSKLLNNELKYFGWFHKTPNLKRKGFRPNSLKSLNAISTFEGNERLFRISPDLINSSRLVKRSSGTEQSNRRPVIYSIAGLGSIGSNLVYFLKTDPNAEFRLIDNDILKPENLGRHLLGFSYLNWYKTTGVLDYLKNNNPFREVTIRKSSVYDVIVNEPEYINESNILIICIGEENIERWIASKIEENVVKIPILFLWVEPYLIGGHCVYITPGDNNYVDLFDKNGLFKFNIIHRDEYLLHNPILSLREAGCQTNYIPYGVDQVLIFLGALYPYVSKIVFDGEMKSKSFTWKSDTKSLFNLNINYSEYGSSLVDGAVNPNEL